MFWAQSSELYEYMNLDGIIIFFLTLSACRKETLLKRSTLIAVDCLSVVRVCFVSPTGRNNSILTAESVAHDTSRISSQKST